ncbi:MAG: flagellar brake domain-containing protein [Syntrophobacteraceae bacterium]
MHEKASEAVVEGRTLNIGIATPLQFQLGIKGHEFKAAGVLVGMVPDEYLLIRIPPIPGIIGRLDEGNPIVVRYVYAGNVYGFTSTVLTCIQKPTLMVFLTYPFSVETMNLRKAQRMECHFIASVKTDMGDYKAVIVDISLGGCRICLDYSGGKSSSVEIDQTIEILFHLTGIAEEQVIKGKIKNLKKDRSFSEIGVQFDQENEAVLNSVKKYIKSFAKLEFLPLVKTL